jgi:hypothetical protein
MIQRRKKVTLGDVGAARLLHFEHYSELATAARNKIYLAAPPLK